MADKKLNELGTTESFDHAYVELSQNQYRISKTNLGKQLTNEVHLSFSVASSDPAFIFAQNHDGTKIRISKSDLAKAIINEGIGLDGKQSGNVALYGATSGTAFINGMAGERFAVRNSGAYAVVEGVGEHGCEYMTGGRVIILGAVGENFAAGMSGGIAYVFDEDDSLNSKINREMVLVEGLDEEDKKFVKEKVGNHYRLTKSARGKMINDDFNNNVAKFKKVIPKDYKEVMEFVREKEVEGLNREEALAFAFNAKVGIN